MPNWCENQVHITGSKKDVAKLQALIGDTFDFNALIPMPKDLQGYSSPVDIISKEEYALQEIKYEKWVKTPKEERKPSYFIRSMTQEISDRFKQEWSMILSSENMAEKKLFMTTRSWNRFSKRLTAL